MARASSAAGNAGGQANNVRLTSRDVTRVVVVLLGITMIVASFFTPWWTRGFSIDWNDSSNPRPTEMAAFEGMYWSYGPFQTPGAGSVSIDGYREFAAAALGIVLVLSSLFVSAHLALRWGMHTGRIEADDNLPVRFAIAAFWLGLAGFLVAAFLLPVAGPNPGWLYGEEAGASVNFDGDGQTFVEDVRFANAGFFIGLLAFVAYPAWLWADAARTRAMNAVGTTTRTGAATANAY